MAKTTIQVSQATKDMLAEFGKMGDTYDSLLRRLLEELKKRRNGDKE